MCVAAFRGARAKACHMDRGPRRPGDRSSNDSIGLARNHTAHRKQPASERDRHRGSKLPAKGFTAITPYLKNRARLSYAFALVVDPRRHWRLERWHDSRAGAACGLGAVGAQAVGSDNLQPKGRHWRGQKTGKPASFNRGG